MTLESDIKRRIQGSLRSHPHFVGMVTNHGGLLGGYRCAPTGWPDTTVTWADGLTFYVEWKSSTGEASKVQKAVHAKLRAAGHLVIVAPRTIGEIVDAVRRYRRP